MFLCLQQEWPGTRMLVNSDELELVVLIVAVTEDRLEQRSLSDHRRAGERAAVARPGWPFAGSGAREPEHRELAENLPNRALVRGVCPGDHLADAVRRPHRRQPAAPAGPVSLGD